MSDKDVQQLVYDELVFDPKVDNRAVAVTVENGVATLRGTVGTFREKREAAGTPPGGSRASTPSTTSSR